MPLPHLTRRLTHSFTQHDICVHQIPVRVGTGSAGRLHFGIPIRVLVAFLAADEECL